MLIFIRTSSERTKEDCQKSVVELENCSQEMEFGEKLQYCGVRTERIYWLDWNASFACWT